jgi:hypothetical protein
MYTLIWLLGFCPYKTRTHIIQILHREIRHQVEMRAAMIPLVKANFNKEVKSHGRDKTNTKGNDKGSSQGN